MTKVNAINVIKIIGQSGRDARIPLEKIKQAMSWAKDNYSNLHIEGLEERMSKMFLRKYGNAVDKLLEFDPTFKKFLKEQLKLEQKIATGLAYGSLAAIAYHATDWRTYGNYVRTFEQEASLFGLPGSSAEFLDETDDFLGRK